MNTSRSSEVVYVTMKICDYNDDGSPLCSGGVPIYAYVDEESANAAVDNSVNAETKYYEKFVEIQGGYILVYPIAAPGHKYRTKSGKYCATAEEAKRLDDWDDWKKSPEGIEIINRMTDEHFYVPVVINKQSSD